MAKHDRLVALAEFEWGKMSTVFLGLNHRFSDDQSPILFETMIFGGGDLDRTMFRYATWEKAEATHNAICQVLIDAYTGTLTWLTCDELRRKVKSRLLAGSKN